MTTNTWSPTKLLFSFSKSSLPQIGGPLRTQQIAFFHTTAHSGPPTTHAPPHATTHTDPPTANTRVTTHDTRSLHSDPLTIHGGPDMVYGAFYQNMAPSHDTRRPFTSHGALLLLHTVPSSHNKWHLLTTHDHILMPHGAFLQHTTALRQHTATSHDTQRPFPTHGSLFQHTAPSHATP